MASDLFFPITLLVWAGNICTYRSAEIISPPGSSSAPLRLLGRECLPHSERAFSTDGGDFLPVSVFLSSKMGLSGTLKKADMYLH